MDNAAKEALKGKPFDIDYRIITANGEERIVHEKDEVVFGKKKNPVRFIGTVQDITERKQAEENLRLSEERYRSFIQNFQGVAFQIDKNFELEFIHGAAKEITGYSEEELFLYTSWRQLVVPEDIDMFLEAEQKAAQSPGDYHAEIEYRIRTNDGKIKWMHELHQKICGEAGSPEKYIGLIYDITEKKKIEEDFAKFEIARQKEIHHRIKNNLQVISSLLDLQAEKFNNRELVQDSEVLEAFRESQDRVISMALIHEELYKGGGLETLNFSPYIEELANTLFHTYRLGNTDISLSMDLEENLFFDMDTAVPLGIIINELVSNSLMHFLTERKEKFESNFTGKNPQNLKSKTTRVQVPVSF
ncbi:MAG TPA: histidine kinase dimerization/phosphoacceptor domain -containing protein [Methanosarcina sp.]|nr:histidine kinase dimerization/phosphoacceptor domain -containing protein [Methanosarcina sp.]